jgi:hypothetical protein
MISSNRCLSRSRSIRRFSFSLFQLTATMYRRFFLSSFCIFCIIGLVFSQGDAYSGSWKMEQSLSTGASAVSIELSILTPERNFLYPANLKVNTNGFSAEYELLLVRKTMWYLAISRNKKPLSKVPPHLENLLADLTGGFAYSRNQKGVASLSFNRMVTNNTKPVFPDSLNLSAVEKATALNLFDYFQKGEIRLVKTSASLAGTEGNILKPAASGAYFGLRDTVLLTTRDGLYNLASNKGNIKKNGLDSVSVTVNGLMLVEQQALDKKKHGDDILLDTGLNIITLFADNFANGLPNKGQLILEFGKEKQVLDFNEKRDSGATFIVAKLYCVSDKSKENSFQSGLTRFDDKPLLKDEKLIDRIIATSQQLTIAIWDDATEDGDSISIMVEGKWLVRGFPVKKNPQFVTVNLKPGRNTFVFVADNLGAIPPNTSVLEIIDGKKRKSYTMETVLGEKNLVEVFYDVKPGF